MPLATGHALSCGLPFARADCDAHHFPRDQSMAAPNDRPLLMAAIDAAQRNDPNRAESLFRRHFLHAREDAVGLADYGNFCLRTGRYPAAIYLLGKAIGLAGGDRDSLTQLGFAQLEVGAADKARESFDAAIRIDSTHPMA